MRRQSEYWKKYLSNSTPCLFPSLTTTSPPSSTATTTSKTTTTRTPLPLTPTHSTNLHTFCTHHAVSPLNVFQLTWAILLAHALSTPDIIFGYRENATFDHTLVVEEESIYRLRFPLDTTIATLLHRNNTRSPRHRAFQTGSVPATLRLAGHRGQRLFNTFLYVEPAGAEESTSPIRERADHTDMDMDVGMDIDMFSFEATQSTDLMRVYDLVLKMSVADSQSGMSSSSMTTGEILCADSLLSAEQASRLAGMFTHVLDAVLVHGYADSSAQGDDESPDELEMELGLDLDLGRFGLESTGSSGVCAQKRVLAARGMGWEAGERRYQKLQV